MQRLSSASGAEEDKESEPPRKSCLTSGDFWIQTFSPARARRRYVPTVPRRGTHRYRDGSRDESRVDFMISSDRGLVMMPAGDVDIGSEVTYLHNEMLSETHYEWQRILTD